MLLGATYAFAAAVQPGPFQTYLIASTLTRGLRRRFRRSWPRSSATFRSRARPSGPHAGAAIRRERAQAVRTACFCCTWRRAFAVFKHYEAPQAARSSPAPMTHADRGGRREPAEPQSVHLVVADPRAAAPRGVASGAGHGIGLLASFYITMIASTAVILIPFAGARSLGPAIGRAMLGVSALVLAAFGVYQMWAGGSALLQRLA